MGRYNSTWSEQKYKQFLNEGRGQGIGSEYKPWLTIQDYPSLGRATRVFGWKSNRIHHFFSDIQTKYFYLLEWQDTVLDIREHFPLIDIDETIKDKEDLNFDIFKDKETSTPYILTTTFLITVKGIDDAKQKYIARSVKSYTELEKKKTLERMEIEKRYWQGKGIDWGIVTQKEIPNMFAKNVEWVHSSLNSYKERGLTRDDMTYLSSILKEQLLDSSHSIRKITANFDREFNYESGTGLFIFKYLVASKQIKIDVNNPIDINASKEIIEVQAENLKKGEKVI
ncbi:TnsA endonuclease C-terminal domain-containing protein [Clostridium kluyveri]|uniref:TnsA endonuclease C-terminal domain-containing protein n=1 Tax=Clostridium kluyveri TaxID=1534 RepID=UPI0022467DA2|nr:TnsA endonuclease C-terminal domain-containing protein [Clostridium kluyveri]UZQ52431.1 TnsA endonuclease N-terminal domain-containing protein [Clostridium kluyveri]